METTRMQLLRWLLFGFWIMPFTSSELLAEDDVILRRVPGINAITDNYTFQILTAALETTKERYGPYTLRYADQEMTRPRTFYEMQYGQKVNVADTPITESWSEKLIRIPIPVQRGILSYRLFLVSDDNTDVLADIESLDELKQVRLGAGSQWSITKILDENQFNVVKGTTKISLMNMLDAGRFSIYGRGLNEVFGELKKYSTSHPGAVLDQHVALYVYLPTYFHVAPSHKRIADRIEVGLRAMNADGTFEKIFREHNEDIIKRARLDERKVFRLSDGPHEEHWENDQKFLFTIPNMQ